MPRSQGASGPINLPSRLSVQEKLAERAEKKLADFIKLSWHVLEPATHYAHNWHIDAICDHLEACALGQIRRLLINVPPRCMKSIAVGVMFPAWLWIQRPQARWMFSSYAQALSIRDSVKCRNVILSEWYQRHWGDRYWLVPDQNTKLRFENSHTGFRLATSVGGLTTGEGADFIVFDDPHNVVQGESDRVREGVIEWWDGTMSTRGNDPATACFIGVMQRIHQTDLSGHLIEKGDYEHLCLPMEYDPKRSRVTSIGWKDPRGEEGDLLWGKRFTEEAVGSLKRTLGPYHTAGQLQQDPVPAGGGIFDKSNFSYCTLLSLGEIEGQKPRKGWPDHAFELHEADGKVRIVFPWECSWFQTADTAGKATENSDYTAVGTYALSQQGDLIVFDMVREKIEIPRQYGFLMSQRGRYPWLEYQAIEDSSSGIGLIQQGRSEGMSFKSLKMLGSKVDNARIVSTAYQNRKVFHMSNAEWLIEFEKELLVFPRGAHDDQVDSLAYAGRLALEMSFQRSGALALKAEDVPKLSDLLGPEIMPQREAA